MIANGPKYSTAPKLHACRGAQRAATERLSRAGDGLGVLVRQNPKFKACQGERTPART